MSEPPTETGILRILEPADLSFTLEAGRLHLTLGDQVWDDLRILPAFPFREPERHLSIQGTIDNGDQEEIGILEDLNSLSEDAQILVRAQLDSNVFIPVINQIESVTVSGDYHTWTVTTNKGPSIFITRDARDKMRLLGPNRYLLEDIDDNRFEIADSAALDSTGRKFVGMYL